MTCSFDSAPRKLINNIEICWCFWPGKAIVTVDQSISVNISFICIILSFYMLFTLRYYYIIIVAVIIWVLGAHRGISKGKYIFQNRTARIFIFYDEKQGNNTWHSAHSWPGESDLAWDLSETEVESLCLFLLILCNNQTQCLFLQISSHDINQQTNSSEKEMVFS